MAQVPLYRRRPVGEEDQIAAYAVVDDDLCDWLSQWRWRMAKGGYASRAPGWGGDRGSILMHRQILGLDHADPRQGDHINRDRLDNRRSNLRVATNAENSQNIKRTSRYRGVSWSQQYGKWTASAMLNRKRHWIGFFDTEEKAAEAARAWRREHMPFATD